MGDYIKQLNIDNTLYDLKAKVDINGDQIDTTYLKLTGGAITGPVTSSSTLHLTSTTDASMDTNLATLTIGALTGTNLAIDNNEILARQNGTTSTLYLNRDGGSVQVGTGGINSAGNIQINRTGGYLSVNSDEDNTSGAKIYIKAKDYNFGLCMGAGGTAHGIYDWTEASPGWFLNRPGTTSGLTSDFHAPSTGFYFRMISYGNGAPSGGNDGDVYIRYI